MFSSNTQFEVGPGGVLLATTRTESRKASTWGNERVSALGRAMFNAMLSDNPISSFQLDIEFSDAELTESELRSLIASLRRPAGGMLIDDALASTLTTQWQALQQSAGSAPAAVVKLGFALGESGRHALRTLCADSARLRMAIATSMVDVCSGNPARDLGRALATFNYTGDPAALFVQHWEDIRRTVGYGLSRYPTLNGVPISQSSKTASLSSPWGAANALRRSIRPAHGIYEALSSAAGWPAQQEVVNRALLELRASAHFKGLSPQGQAALLAARAADFYDAIGSRFAAVLFDRNDDVPTNTLFVIALLAVEAGAEVHAKVVHA
jgi:hypothetical protein